MDLLENSEVVVVVPVNSELKEISVVYTCTTTNYFS